MLPEPTVVWPSKSDRTRTAIVDAALALFTEQGFDVTTVRQIAARAGVSVGNAYYYFDSKEQLVLSIYEQFAKTTVEPVLDSVAKGGTPTELIERAMLIWLKVMRPYRSFAAVMFRNVVDPASAMSPLGPAPAPVREQSYEIWRTVLTRATDTTVPDQFVEPLSRMLWGYALAIVYRLDAGSNGGRSLYEAGRSSERAAGRSARLVRDDADLRARGRRASGAARRGSGADRSGRYSETSGVTTSSRRSASRFKPLPTVCSRVVLGGR